jgi:transcriptional regulator with XRE-family HTH domain
MIGERIKELRESIGLKQVPFARSLDISQAAISLIEKGRGASLDTIMKISKIYQVPIEWITEGKGAMGLVSNNQNITNVISEAKQVYSSGKGNIVFVPLVAYGGFMEGYESILFKGSLDHFSLPGISGDHAAFEVSGDSMVPFAYHREIVIAKPEEKIEWMMKSRVYVIVSVRGIHVKIFDKISPKQEFAHFKSANKNSPKFEPLPLKDIKKIYQVIRVLDDPYKRGYGETNE